jgi:hypothetical protein
MDTVLCMFWAALERWQSQIRSTRTRQAKTERVVGLCYDGNEYPAKSSFHGSKILPTSGEFGTVGFEDT